jgi:hypothetical protein
MKPALGAALGVMGLLAAMPAARASGITADDSGFGDVMINTSEFVDGNSAKSMMLVLPNAGELRLDFTDMDFTGALDTLEFGLSETSSSVSGMIDADSMTIDFTRPTTLYLDVFARADKQTGFGLYNIYASFQPQVVPVPLPASGVSLAGGLAALLWLFRRRGQVTVMGAVA